MIQCNVKAKKIPKNSVNLPVYLEINTATTNWLENTVWMAILPSSGQTKWQNFTSLFKCGINELNWHLNSSFENEWPLFNYLRGFLHHSAVCLPQGGVIRPYVLCQWSRTILWILSNDEASQIIIFDPSPLYTEHSPFSHICYSLLWIIQPSVTPLWLWAFSLTIIITFTNNYYNERIWLK